MVPNRELLGKSSYRQIYSCTVQLQRYYSTSSTGDILQVCDTWSILVLYCTGIVPVQYSTGTGSTGSTGSVEYLNRHVVA